MSEEDEERHLKRKLIDANGDPILFAIHMEGDLKRQQRKSQNEQ